MNIFTCIASGIIGGIVAFILYCIFIKSNATYLSTTTKTLNEEQSKKISEGFNKISKSMDNISKEMDNMFKEAFK